MDTNSVIPPNYKQKSRSTYTFLALIWGDFGLHNFYAGYKGRGAIQLLFCWSIIPLFVAWIEMFTVKKDANGVPFKNDGFII